MPTPTSKGAVGNARGSLGFAGDALDSVAGGAGASASAAFASEFRARGLLARLLRTMVEGGWDSDVAALFDMGFVPSVPARLQLACHAQTS